MARLAPKIAGALASLAVWPATRWIRGRRAEEEVDARSVRGPTGVILGAEAITLEGDDRGALLLHGFGDTPQSMRRLAEHLHARGWSVRVPLLPGHGRTLREFASTNRVDWYVAARSAYDALRLRTAHVAVIGQSMGGALAVCLAVERPDLRALVLLAPYLSMPPRAARLARLQGLIGLFSRYLRTHAEASIRDAAARSKSLGYGFASPRLMRELRRLTREAWSAAPSVRAPTLVLQSRHDNRITPQGAETAFRRLGAHPSEFVWVDEGGHVLTVDFGCETVFARTSEWLERFVTIASGASPPAIPRSA